MEFQYFDVATLADRRCDHREGEQGCALWADHEEEHLLCPLVVLETLDRAASYEQLTGQTLDTVKERWGTRFAGLPPHELARDIPAELAAARFIVDRLDGNVSMERDDTEEQELARHEQIVAALGTREPIWAIYSDSVAEAVNVESERLRQKLAEHGVAEVGWRDDEPSFGQEAQELEQLLELIDQMDGDPIWRFYSDKRIWSALATRERLRRQIAELDRTQQSR